MELAISTDTVSNDILGPHIKLAQSTEFADSLGLRELLLLAPLQVGLISPSTSTYLEDFEEYPITT